MTNPVVKAVLWSISVYNRKRPRVTMTIVVVMMMMMVVNAKRGAISVFFYTVGFVFQPSSYHYTNWIWKYILL